MRLGFLTAPFPDTPLMDVADWAASADFDVFHLHFGFDACSPADLAELVGVLR